MGVESELVIRAEAIVKVYNDGMQVRALDGVDLAVRRGEFLAVMGPSGSGKSTLLNVIGALDSPTSGGITLDGRDIVALSGNPLADLRRERIGFVFQLFNLVPTLTALENVMLPLVPYRRAVRFRLQDRARDLLEAFGLGGRIDHLPGQLSGGEQQRVAIARALINKPTVILADEPTGNLDTKAGDEVMELLRQVREEHGCTLVVVTHSPRVAAHAERVIFLKDGRVVDETTVGTAQDLAILWKHLGLG